MERVGIRLRVRASGLPQRLHGKETAITINGDPVAFIISKNIHRRHLTSGQLAAALVKLAEIEVGKETGSSEPVSELKGGRGRKSPIKAKAVEINAALPEDQRVSESSIKRAINKAEGRVPKPKAVNRSERGHTIMRRPVRPKSGPVYSARGIDAARQHYLRHAELAEDLDAEQEIIVDASRAIDSQRALNGGRSKGRASTLPLATPDIGQPVDDFFPGDIPECLDRRRRP